MTQLIDLDVFSCDLDGVCLIEASAGTGKTWNICALYVRLLLEAIDGRADSCRHLHQRGHGRAA